MELGSYYHSNQKRIALLSEAEWRVALAKCEDHIRWKLRQKTLYGVHSSAQLGADPIDYYISLAYEKIISGFWEFQQDMSITEQMIRVIDSYISKMIEHGATQKAESFKIVYPDVIEEFYEYGHTDHDSGANEVAFANRIKAIDEAVADDIELDLLWDAVKEGKKRNEIATLLDKTLRQFDKLREKLIKKVRDRQSV